MMARPAKKLRDKRRATLALKSKRFLQREEVSAPDRKWRTFCTGVYAAHLPVRNPFVLGFMQHICPSDVLGFMQHICPSETLVQNVRHSRSDAGTFAHMLGKVPLWQGHHWH